MVRNIIPWRWKHWLSPGDCNIYEGQAEELPISELAPASQQVLGKAAWISIFLAQQLRIFRGKHNKLSFCLCFFFLLLPDHKHNQIYTKLPP